MGYNFSIAGVAGRTTGLRARRRRVGRHGRPVDAPMPLGMVWNMVDDTPPAGTLPPVATRSSGGGWRIS